MSTLDLLILGGYVMALVAMSAVCSRSQKSLKDYFLGGQNIPWWAAAFSGIATILSAISFLGAPGQAFKSDLQFLQYRLATPFTILLIGWVLIPFFYGLRLFTIYEYLEKRFDMKTRLLASATFVVLKLCIVGIGIYAPGLILAQMTGYPLLLLILFMGLFTALYTMAGGMRAVIWTDTFQLGILVLGLAVAAWVVMSQLGSLGQVYTAASEAGKLRFFNWSTSVQEEFTVWGGLIGGTFMMLSQYGVDQAELQKFLTTSSLNRSRLALISTIVFAALIGFFYFFLGSALWVFYSHRPDALATPPDRIFARFIIEELPTGVRGLLLAAVFAAAMSTVSSLLNSLTTVLMRDFQERFSGRPGTVTQARLITFALGVVCTLMALYADRFGNLLVASSKLSNFFGGSLAGTFLLGMLWPRANGTGAFWGLLAGIVSVSMVAAFTAVSWVWYGFVAASVAAVAGALLSLLAPPPGESRMQFVYGSWLNKWNTARKS